MMNDYINKKVNFHNSKISVKIVKLIHYGVSSKIYLCSDINQPSRSYSIKIASARSDDKATCNSLNTEIITLVRYLYITSKYLNINIYAYIILNHNLK